MNGEIMIKNIKKESFLNLISASALGLFLLYMYQGLGELVVAFLVFPYIVLYMSEGAKITIVSLLLTFAFGLLFLNPIILAYLALFVSITTFVMVYMIKQKMPAGRIMLYGTFIKLAFIFLVLGMAYIMEDTNPIDSLRESLTFYMEQMLKTLENNLQTSATDIQTMRLAFRQLIDQIISVLPGMLFIFSFFQVAVNFFISLKLINRTSGPIAYISKLNLYGSGPGLRMASMVSIVTVILLYLFNYVYLNSFVNNILLILGFFYFFNGLFLMDFSYEISGRKWMRFIVPFMLIVLLQSYVIYIVVGFIDMIFDFRRRLINSARKK